MKQKHMWKMDAPLGPIIDEFLDVMGSGKSNPVNVYLLFTEYLIDRVRQAECLIDSQAQKITEQAKEIERLKEDVANYLRRLESWGV